MAMLLPRLLLVLAAVALPQFSTAETTHSPAATDAGAPTNGSETTVRVPVTNGNVTDVATTISAASTINGALTNAITNGTVTDAIATMNGTATDSTATMNGSATLASAAAGGTAAPNGVVTTDEIGLVSTSQRPAIYSQTTPFQELSTLAPLSVSAQLLSEPTAGGPEPSAGIATVGPWISTPFALSATSTQFTSSTQPKASTSLITTQSVQTNTHVSSLTDVSTPKLSTATWNASSPVFSWWTQSAVSSSSMNSTSATNPIPASDTTNMTTSEIEFARSTLTAVTTSLTSSVSRQSADPVSTGMATSLSRGVEFISSNSTTSRSVQTAVDTESTSSFLAQNVTFTSASSLGSVATQHAGVSSTAVQEYSPSSADMHFVSTAVTYVATTAATATPPPTSVQTDTVLLTQSSAPTTSSMSEFTSSPANTKSSASPPTTTTTTTLSTSAHTTVLPSTPSQSASMTSALPSTQSPSALVTSGLLTSVPSSTSRVDSAGTATLQFSISIADGSPVSFDIASHRAVVRNALLSFLGVAIDQLLSFRIDEVAKVTTASPAVLRGRGLQSLLRGVSMSRRALSASQYRVSAEVKVASLASVTTTQFETSFVAGFPAELAAAGESLGFIATDFSIHDFSVAAEPSTTADSTLFGVMAAYFGSEVMAVMVLLLAGLGLLLVVTIAVVGALATRTSPELQRHQVGHRSLPEHSVATSQSGVSKETPAQPRSSPYKATTQPAGGHVEMVNLQSSPWSDTIPEQKKGPFLDRSATNKVTASEHEQQQQQQPPPQSQPHHARAGTQAVAPGSPSYQRTSSGGFMF
eukprot:INCI11901.1.p1 GENE.INCI11901.1~~INCI11901.1.p1  ORF type:complete len:812 (+),score=132.81 INCI11901.1:110-2545(+)